MEWLFEIDSAHPLSHDTAVVQNHTVECALLLIRNRNLASPVFFFFFKQRLEADF